MRLLLIAPSWDPAFWKGGKTLAPPMSLPVLAALTPPGFEVHLVDEHVEPVDLAEPADLVAISCLTASAPRGYAIADHFRACGVPVALGGMHPSAVPAEAAEHADAVVIGEAEGLWPRVVADLAAGRPERIYRSERPPELADLPLPRRDLLHRERYLTVNLVQTARGCPHACRFCSVSRVFGRRYRFRPIEEVIEEIRSLHAPWVGLTDDNVVASRPRAMELFEALLPLGLRWVGQGDLSMARDEELLKLMVRSGCVAMFVGLESLSADGLREANKRPNLGLDCEQAVAAIHRHGIEIMGSFVFGFDSDHPDVFRRTVAFAERVKLAAAQFPILTPLPDTALYDDLTREGRITSHDWSRYTLREVVFQPRNMTAEELLAGRLWANRRFYSAQSIARRSVARRGGRGRWLLRTVVNLSFRRIHRGGRIADRVPGERTPPRTGA